MSAVEVVWNVVFGLFGSVAFMVGTFELISQFELSRFLIRKALRRTPEHLRGRKPAEGMPMPHGAQPVNPRLVDVHPTAEPGIGVDAEWQLEAIRSREWAMRMANRLPDTREQAGLADARAFRAWLDARRTSPPTVFEYEGLREDWRRQQRDLPTPAENARRYSAEGGTW